MEIKREVQSHLPAAGMACTRSVPLNQCMEVKNVQNM